MPALLASLPEAARALSWAVVVVDNYGLDDLPDVIGSDASVTLVRPHGNLGYSGGLNFGLQHVPPSRFTVFLNPDLSLEPGALSELADACATPGVVATVPLVVDEGGAHQRSLRREPSLSRALGEAVLGDHWPGRPHWLSEMIRIPSRYRAGSTIDWATGAALLVRSDMLPVVGDWDAERFFLYSEETDFARRIRQEGGTLWFVPTAVVKHRGAGSGTSPELDALLSINKVRYYRKWHGRLASAAFFGVIVLHNVLRVRRPGSRAALKALFSRRARAALPGGVE